jgi:hypothetical protein
MVVLNGCERSFGRSMREKERVVLIASRIKIPASGADIISDCTPSQRLELAI